MSRNKRLHIDGGQSFVPNPFAALRHEGLPSGGETSPAEAGRRSAEEGPRPQKNRGRVDIIRQTAHRGGKTVTVVSGFTGIGLPEKESLAKTMQKACGTGGTVKEGGSKFRATSVRKWPVSLSKPDSVRSLPEDRFRLLSRWTGGIVAALLNHRLIAG